METIQKDNNDNHNFDYGYFIVILLVFAAFWLIAFNLFDPFIAWLSSVGQTHLQEGN